MMRERGVTIPTFRPVRSRHRSAVTPPEDEPSTSFSGHVAAQYVVGSDGSLSGSVALDNGLLRMSVTAHHFFERQQRRPPWTLTMPAAVLGIRIDDRAATRAYLQGGVVHAWTRHDPAGNRRLAGPLFGVHVEHALTPRRTLIGEAHAMYFVESDARAYAVRVAIRHRFAELAIRALAFNTGPVLYGTEVGTRF
jgi:hypothetical protein